MGLHNRREGEFMKKNFIIILIIVSIIVIGGALLFPGFFSKSPEPEKITGTSLNSSLNPTTPLVPPGADLPHILKTTGKIRINATVYMNSSSLPVYRGVVGENGSINLQLQQIGKSRQNVTTPEEAPEAARKAMEPYGGLPADAVYDGARMSYIEMYDHDLKKTTFKEPMFITVFYSMDFHDMPILGDTNSILLTLGTKGELLRIFKVWRNYTYTGDVPIIPVDTAIEKLEREELIDSAWHPEEAPFIIDSIGQGYYTKDAGNSETLLEPVWIFFGSGRTGTRLGLYVYGRQFANFTATHTTGIAPLKVRFADTSDTTPWKWHWDFGDGTNSTEKNPVHTYKKPGTYNVSLTVWNDLGSDTISRDNLVSISSGIPDPDSGQTGSADRSGKTAGNT